MTLGVGLLLTWARAHGRDVRRSPHRDSGHSRPADRTVAVSYFRPIRRLADFLRVGSCSGTRLVRCRPKPPVPDAPGRVWRDWALVSALVPVVVLGGAFWEDLVWRALSMAVALALLPTLLWRRTHPLQSVAAAFGLIAVVKVASLILGDDWRGLDATVFVMLLVYALFRWGSGRDAVIGLAILSFLLLLSAFDAQMRSDEIPLSEVAEGALFVLLVAAVGASVRYADKARRRGMDQMKFLEREQLARELHDTVAHHVSAIAIRAQAGRVVASTDPAAAVEALAVIEQEASRTLAEMRTMVSALRQGEEPDLTPQRGVAQVEGLATSPGERPRVDVELSGDLDGLRPSVDVKHRSALQIILQTRVVLLPAFN